MLKLQVVLGLLLHTLVLTNAGAPPFSENDQRCYAAMQDILGQMERIVKAKVYELNGWLKSRNYIFKHFEDWVDYKTAERQCKQLGGRLATEILRHCETVRFMIAYNYPESSRGFPWIGYNDRATEGSWVWADGGVTDSQTTEWITNEPSSFEWRDDDCAQLVANNDGKVLMSSQTCRTRHPYICEINTDDL